MDDSYNNGQLIERLFINHKHRTDRTHHTHHKHHTHRTHRTGMSYRGIKRLLGESSLERKILILFGVCLLLLIGGSFLWVNRVTEQVILENTRDRAKGLAGDFMLRTHLKNVMFKKNANEESLRKLFDEVNNYVQTVDYHATTVVLDDSIGRNNLQPVVAQGVGEEERLKKLVPFASRTQTYYNRLMRDNAIGQAQGLDAIPPQASILNSEDDGDFDFTFDENYLFYTPVIFKEKCIACHDASGNDAEFLKQIDNANSVEAIEELTYNRRQTLPSTFLRVQMNYQQARQAVNKNRAILISVAIVTAVFAVVVCLLIVRYVVMKPLRHLQDVSDEISRGQMEVRAELFTGDEFESLSKSFNRMVRHLLDTQTELRGVNDDLDRKVDEQAQLNLKLYEMNQVKSEFLASMSHELRTPLNSIIGFSEILENAKGLEKKQVRFAKNIRNSGRLLLDLINDILDLAKLEAAKMEIRTSEFSINKLVQQLCDMVRALAEKKNIELVFKPDDRLPDLYQDKIKIRQIMTNLISNAIKFTPEGGRIIVTAKLISGENDFGYDGDRRATGGDQIELHVEDTGVGIAESDQDIIFEKFRQGPSAIGSDSLTREVSGTGLGLSIVKELCKLLGGTISLSSVVGKGSTFTVILPCNIQTTGQFNSEIEQSLAEITKTSRVDFGRTSLTPQPPAEGPPNQRPGHTAMGGRSSR